jgi:hypothetical protein
VLIADTTTADTTTADTTTAETTTAETTTADTTTAHTTTADTPAFEYPPLPSVANDPVDEEAPPRATMATVRLRHGRAILSALLATAAVACLLVGNVALWMRQDVYSARNVDQEAQQIMGSSDVQQAVADLLTTQVVQPALDHAGLGPFRGLVSGPVMGVARRAIDDAVASQPAQHVAARLVEQVVPELDKGTGPVVLSPEQLAWIVSPSLASNHLVASLLHTADHSGCCQVVLVQRGHLSFGWRHVREIRIAGLVLPALSLVLAALAIAVSRRRVRTAMLLAAAAAVAGLLTFVSLQAGPGMWAGVANQHGPAAGVIHAAQRTAFSSVTATLRQHSLSVAGAGGVAVAILAAARWVKSVTVARRA